MKHKRKSHWKHPYSTAASPLKNLPNEIQLNIFRETADPIKVTRVCPAWEKLAMADASLWSTIKVDDTKKGHYCCNDPKTLNLYLKRSRSAPLTVEICTCDVDEEEDRHYFKDGNVYGYEGDDEDRCICLSSLRLILDHLPRIKKLKVFCEPDAQSRGITEILRKAFSVHQVPILENLELSTYDDLWWSPGTVFYPTSAPALRKLLLNDVIVDWNSAIFRNLTELYVNVFNSPDQCMKITQVSNILLACPALTTLLLSLHIILDTTSDSRIGPINLPSLMEITLWNLPINVYEWITQNIRVHQCANWYIQERYPSEKSLPQFCGSLRTLAAKMDDSQPRDLTLVLENDTLSFFSSRLIKDDTDSKRLKDYMINVSFRLDDCEELDADCSSHFRNLFFKKVAQITSALNTNDTIIHFCVRFRDLDTNSRVKSVLGASKDWAKLLLFALPKLKQLQLKLFFCPEEIDDENEDSDSAGYGDEDTNGMRNENVEEDEEEYKNSSDEEEEGSEDEDNLGHERTKENKTADENCSFYYKKGILEGMIEALTPLANTQASTPGTDLQCPNLECVEITHGHGTLSGGLLQCLKLRSTYGARVRMLNLTWSSLDISRKQISDGWLAEAKQYVEGVSVHNEDDKTDWNWVFRPGYERTGDNSYGYLSGYYQYDTSSIQNPYDSEGSIG